MGIVEAEMRVEGSYVNLDLNLRLVKKFIMIDCDQESSDQCLANVLGGTPLKCKPPQNVSNCEFTFDFSNDVSSPQWNNILPIIVKNLHNLQDSGSVRYAEWTPRIK